MTEKAENNRGFVPRRLFLQGTMAAAAGALIRPVVSRQSATPAGLQTEEVVDVTDPRFGAVGDGVTNDRDAFQAAIDFAIRRRRVLWIPEPAESYRIVLESEKDHLEINGRLTMRGAGRLSTLLNFGLPQPDPSKINAGIVIRNGYNVEITGLRFDEDARPAELEFAAILIETGPDNHKVLIEDVDIENFTYCIYSPSGGSDGVGELFLTVRRCDLSPDRRFAIAFWSGETVQKRLHIYDSYIHDNTEAPLVYCHPNNSVHVENTRFDGAATWAFHFQGSAVAGDPEYQRFIGCWFGPRNGRGLITQKRKDVYTNVEVRNCVFEGRPAIQIRSDMTIDGCYFTTPLNAIAGSSTFIAAYEEAPWKARITNCIFAARSDSNPAVDLRLSGVEVTVENCQFYNQNYGTMIALGLNSQNVYDISNCLFYTRATPNSHMTAISAGDGQTTISRCRFVGRAPGDRGLLLFTATDAPLGPETRYQIDDCLMNNISGGSLFHVEGASAGSWSERIFGSNNRITNLVTALPLLTVDPAGTPVYAFLNPVSGRAPAPLTAGTTLVITSNFDTYEVLGAADVTFIHWWYPDGLSDPLFSGVVTLSSGTGFTLVSGGNIDLDGGTSRAVPAGTDVRLFYDSSKASWTVVEN